MSWLDELPRRSWIEAEPSRVIAEKEAMAIVAPEMIWDDASPGGGWEGLAPVWPFDRPPPPSLDAFLAGRRLRLNVTYPEAFPAVEPWLTPLDPAPPLTARADHRWHLNGNGTLCLTQSAADWTGMEPAAELVRKAAGWFLEYLLMTAGTVEQMTERGLVADDSRDALLVATAPQPEEPDGAVKAASSDAHHAPVESVVSPAEEGPS